MGTVYWLCYQILYPLTNSSNPLLKTPFVVFFPSLIMFAGPGLRSSFFCRYRNAVKETDIYLRWLKAILFFRRSRDEPETNLGRTKLPPQYYRPIRQDGNKVEVGQRRRFPGRPSSRNLCCIDIFMEIGEGLGQFSTKDAPCIK